MINFWRFLHVKNHSNVSIITSLNKIIIFENISEIPFPCIIKRNWINGEIKVLKNILKMHTRQLLVKWYKHILEEYKGGKISWKSLGMKVRNAWHINLPKKNSKWIAVAHSSSHFHIYTHTHAHSKHAEGDDRREIILCKCFPFFLSSLESSQQKFRRRGVRKDRL